MQTEPQRNSNSELARLKALRRYEILDTETESSFDQISQLAGHIMATPVALVCFIDENRAWFKSRTGTSVSEVPRDIGFCGHTIAGTGPMVVEDATLDDRFKQSPLVTGEGGFRFYAGTSITTPDGFKLGTICVLDRVPRKASADQLAALEKLASLAATLLESRRALKSTARAPWAAAGLDTLISLCAWCKSIRNPEGEWESLESYLQGGAHSRVSHCICPECSKKNFREFHSSSDGI